MKSRNQQALLREMAHRELRPSEDKSLGHIEALRLAFEGSDDAGRRSAAAKAARQWRSLEGNTQRVHVCLLSGLWKNHSLANRPEKIRRVADSLIKIGKRSSRPEIQAEGLIGKGIAELRSGTLEEAVKALELSKALFASTGFNAIDVVRASIPLADALRLSNNRSSALGLLERAKEICFRMEEVPLLASVLQTLGTLYIESGKLDSARECFQFVIQSSKAIGSWKRKLRGSLGLAKASARCGLADQATREARSALYTSTKSELSWEVALANEYLGDAHTQLGEWSQALKHYSRVNKFAVKGSSVEIGVELHSRLANLWIECGNAYYSELHCRKGQKLQETGPALPEDVFSLQRSRLEVKWLQGKGEESLSGLIAHAEEVRTKGFGYEHLLTARRIATVADSLGKQDVAAQWWAKTEFLAQVCSAEPLLERWRSEREEHGYVLTSALETEESSVSPLADELPKIDLRAHGIITKSKKLEEQGAWIGRLAPTKVPVLICGESGTGKELFAKLTHQLSDRRTKPFMAINCGALPSELLESELFGHRRGSFTGAVNDKTGLLQSAHQGTILLDEVGEMPPSGQTKLLRVLENGELRQVGETKTEIIDVRVVAATNVDLAKAVNQGTFRRDLYYRLKGLEIFLPPLRERVSDIPVLANHFLHKVNQECGKSLELPFETRQWLMGLPWHGNVRELRLAIERAAALARDSGSLLRYHFVSSESETDGKSLPHELEEIERERLKNALEATDWNASATARLLKMSRTTLTGRIKKLGIRRPS